MKIVQDKIYQQFQKLLQKKFLTISEFELLGSYTYISGVNEYGFSDVHNGYVWYEIQLKYSLKVYDIFVLGYGENTWLNY